MSVNKKVRGVKTWLKENGYTAEQMQAFWDELIDLNATVRALHNSGVNWDETNMSIISQLPTEKERTLARKAEAEKKEQEKREAEEKVKAEKAYYEEHFEEIMLAKIDKGESLTESELRTLVFEFGIETEVGDKLRWVQSMFTVVKLCDRTFGINWLEALTEYQENEFIEQPYEVRLQEKVEIRKVKHWNRVGESDLNTTNEIDLTQDTIELTASKVVIEKLKNGVEPAIFITSNNQVYMVCATNSGDFSITNEGIVGEKYDSDGNWCEQ